MTRGDKPKTAAEMAFSDITKYIEDNNLIVMEGGDVLIVTPVKLNTKEQRRLNRDIGVSKVNYTGNSNIQKNQKHHARK
jgi:hypothetical protein|tara:strand:- start:17 stop:253 length:237 start_codon:yes stop_codon:yes gene_type:complete